MNGVEFYIACSHHLVDALLRLPNVFDGEGAAVVLKKIMLQDNKIAITNYPNPPTSSQSKLVGRSTSSTYCTWIRMTQLREICQRDEYHLQCEHSITVPARK
jgi:hypothetical protein